MSKKKEAKTNELTKIEVLSDQQFYEFIGRMYQGIDILSIIDSGHVSTLEQLREYVQMSVDNLDRQTKRQREIKAYIESGALDANHVYGCFYCLEISLPDHKCNKVRKI